MNFTIRTEAGFTDVTVKQPLLCEEEMRHCLYLKLVHHDHRITRFQLKGTIFIVMGPRASHWYVLQGSDHFASLSLSCMHGFPFAFTLEPLNVPFTQYSTFRKEKSIEWSQF